MNSRVFILLPTVLGALAPASYVAAEDPPARRSFEQAAAQLAAEQYPRMLRIANDRMRLCPDPESAFLARASPPPFRRRAAAQGARMPA